MTCEQSKFRPKTGWKSPAADEILRDLIYQKMDEEIREKFPFLGTEYAIKHILIVFRHRDYPCGEFKLRIEL